MTARDVIQRLHAEAMRTRDLATLDAWFAPDFVSHNVPPGLPDGVEGAKAFFAMFRDAIPDAEVTVDQVVDGGEWAAVATTTRGTHAETGRRVAVTGIDMVRVRDGRIAEHRGLTDTVGFLRQIRG
jgi:ketosteroid isomerase-like protein